MKKATRKPWGGKRPGAGRPASGQDPVTAIRLSKEMRARVNAWAAQQPDEPGRSEAIRRLVDLGLTIRETVKQPSPASAARAKEMAAKAIERISDPAVPHDERVQRRRRLTKGPIEFRDDRIDQPKAKGK